MDKVTQTIEETIKYMWRNEKNRLFMGLMLILMLVYVLLFAPDFNSQHDLNVDDLEYEMTGNAVQAQNAKENGFIVPSIMTGTTAYIEQKHEAGLQRELFTTIKQGDIYRYLETKAMMPPEEEEDEVIETSVAGLFFNVFGEDPLFLKLHRFIQEIPNLNFHIVHEITSLQQLHLFFIGAGPLILLIGLVFMISDVHTKDFKLASQKQGIPMHWGKYLLVQSGAALGFVFIFYLFFFGVFFLLNGLLHGFGSLSFPIGFSQETIGWFLLRTIPYILVLLILFTRLNTLFSLWTKQPIVTMAILIFIVFFSSIYMDANTGDVLSFNLGYLPTSYIDFGQIIIGNHSLRPIMRGLSVYSSGLLVLTITLVFTEISLYVTAKRLSRQKFIAWGAE